MASRTKLNFGIDFLAFVALLALISTGALLFFVLPPGSGGRYLVWGLTRHEWGEVHGIAALIMVATISVHLFLHWRWVIAVAQGARAVRSGARLVVGVVAMSVLLGIAAAPLLSPVERSAGGDRGRIQERGE